MITITYQNSFHRRMGLPMSSPGSVTHWIGQLKAGDATAAQPLWERYFHRLVLLAGKRLRDAPRAPVNGEDVALSVFDRFCRDAARGALPQLSDRDGLWQWLVVNTAHKAIDVLRGEQSRKRGGGRRHEVSDEELQRVLGDEPSPDFAAEVAEEYRRLLDLLPGDDLRQLAIWRMEGYTLDEIAIRMNCVTRTVKRRLQLIRDHWEQEGVS